MIHSGIEKSVTDESMTYTLPTIARAEKKKRETTHQKDSFFANAPADPSASAPANIAANADPDASATAPASAATTAIANAIVPANTNANTVVRANAAATTNVNTPANASAIKILGGLCMSKSSNTYGHHRSATGMNAAPIAIQFTLLMVSIIMGIPSPSFCGSFNRIYRPAANKLYPY